MKNLVLAAMITAMLFLFSCSSSKKSNPPAAANIDPLYQTAWKLTELEGESINAQSRMSLNFTKGESIKVSGNAGCNRLSGTVEIHSTGSLKFSPLATTKMICTDNRLVQLENKFLTTLAAVDEWSISNEVLLLQQGNTVLAKFEKQQSASKINTALNGAWELNYIAGANNSFDKLFPNKKPTILFDFAKRQASGNGGCNGYSCNIKTSAGIISFGDVLSTMMACEGNGEPLYFSTLKTVTAYSITDNTLTMLAGDIAVMRFTRK